MVEALIAAAILLIIAIGILPLFIRSIANNSTAGELSQKVNQTDARLEEYYPYNVANALLSWGGTAALTTNNYYTLGVDRTAALGTAADQGWAGEGWVPDTTRGAILWQRTTRIRNFNISDMDNAALNDAGALPPSFPPTPLLGNADPVTVSLKEITVTLQSYGTGRMDAINSFNNMTFTNFKAF
ncbi:MAG: hypothetical protein ABI603_11415 [Acidobacteriota bacterium]